ncbi:MAG: DUF5005 domain-containing protein [Treponema sp.]|nr:DUF5005 domain-containing protein [Treponema sp.]
MNKTVRTIAVMTLLAALLSCGTGTPRRITSSVPVPSPSFPLELVQLTPADPAYVSITNNSGMSGSPVGNIHFHNNRPADMYAGEIQDFIFDMNRTEQLGKMNVWNHNAGAGANGLRDITVSFSEDNVQYTELGSFTLKQGGGTATLSATNLVDNSIIDFNGASARYIKIAPESNYGGEQYGLSEIRLSRYRHAVYQGSYIGSTPIFDLRGRLPPAEASNLTSGVGLSHPTSADAQHSNEPAHMFTVSGRQGSFDIDTHGRYPLQKIVIWNYNEAGNTNWGLESITVRLSDDLENWTTFISNTAIPAGTGQNGMGPSVTIPMNNEAARFIRISGANRGGPNAGLSAVRVYVGEGWFADRATDWTALFSVYPTSNSEWAGADGVFSVNLDGRDFNPARRPEDRKTLWTFQDSITSRVNPITAARMGFGMPNNTRAVLTGNPHHLNLTFNTEAIKPDPPVPHQFYWIGDNFVVGDKLYILGGKVDNSTGGEWGFFGVGNDLARFTIVNGEIDESSLIIFNDATEGRYLSNSTASPGQRGNSDWGVGNAVFENTVQNGAINPDGYIYLYGVASVPAGQFPARRLIVARVQEANVEDFTKIEYYWNDNTWRNEPWGKSVTNQKYLNPGNQTQFAGECSIHQMQWGPDRGKFYHVYMDTQFFDRWLRVRVADSPYGDFTDMRRIFFAIDPFMSIPPEGHKDMYTYNGKAHPSISPEGELILTYNTNGGEAMFADMYRPHFVRYAVVPPAPAN